LQDRPFDSGAGYDSENKLFVGNLSWTVDDESLGAKFSNLHGKVLDAKVTFDKESGRSRGFGFVTYSNAEEVNEAIQNFGWSGKTNSEYLFHCAELHFMLDIQ
jgi:RNA recognition motif-containing protein